jgi:FkbM family methyltransferase
MLTSYAQNFEDVILWRCLKHIEKGFYIDIGAQDPVVHSVSLAFYGNGWRGVHVEPAPTYAAKLREARPDEEVVQAAIGKGSGLLTLYEISETGLSTGDPAIAAQHAEAGYQANEVSVPLLSLGDLLDRYADRDIHWLKIDVEGMEQATIESWPPSKVRPWIVVVESTLPNSPETNHERWEPQLSKLGYRFVYFDGLNRFYVCNDHEELAAAFGPGPNYFDGFELAELASLREARKEAERLQERLGQAEMELVSLREARQQTERLQDKLRDAEIELVSLREARQQAEHLQDKLRDTEMELASLREARQEAEYLQNKLRDAEMELTALRAELGSEMKGARQAITDLTAGFERLSDALGPLQSLQAWNHRAERAERELHTAQLARQEADQQLQAVLNSTSWRVTAGMRTVGRAAKAPASHLRLAYRPALKSALIFTQRRPALKAQAKRLLGSVPAVEAYLRRFAEAHQVFQSPHSHENQPYLFDVQAARLSARWNPNNTSNAIVTLEELCAIATEVQQEHRNA